MTKEIKISLTDEFVEDFSREAGFSNLDIANNMSNLHRLMKNVAKIILSSDETRETIFQEELEKRSKVDETREVNRKEFNELSALVDEVVIWLVSYNHSVLLGDKIKDRAESLKKRKQIAELHDKIKRLESEG
jgi:hypothetical protein